VRAKINASLDGVRAVSLAVVRRSLPEHLRTGIFLCALVTSARLDGTGLIWKHQAELVQQAAAHMHTVKIREQKLIRFLKKSDMARLKTLYDMVYSMVQ
jgi:hypothetical protein